MTKTVYLVRHGQSEANAGGVRQGAGGNLTEAGREQAEYLARRVAKLPIEAIVSSTSPRARQTAEIINQELGLEIIETDLVVERKNPSSVIGKYGDDPEVVEMSRRLIEGYKDPDFHLEDAESFNDIKRRVFGTLEMLESHPAENILVVTHGMFMRFLLTGVLFGQEFTFHEAEGFCAGTKTKNTGLTVLQYDPTEPRPWMLVTWNDHAHLADA